MTSVLVPDEAAGHLGAILLAFNREIFGSLLSEAEELAGLGQATSAVLVAGTVIEYLEKSPTAELLSPTQRHEMEEWRRLRNQVAHGSPGDLSPQQAQLMVTGIRGMLNSLHPAGHPRCSTQVSNAGASAQPITPASIKGKYAHVPTSSDDFMRRKHAELELEDRE
jgi:hypothetical protein